MVNLSLDEPDWATFGHLERVGLLVLVVGVGFCVVVSSFVVACVVFVSSVFPVDGRYEIP